MAFTYFGREIRKVGVIGSGNIGPDIAIHLSQNLFSYEVPIIVVGRRQVSLDNASKKIEAKMTKIARKGILNKKDSDAVVKNILYTTDYSQLSDVDFVMEAAPERVEVKQRIFEQCQEICSKNTILASNSSHIIPEEIFRNVADKSRCLVIHYFFPAERNLLVEIVPSKETDPDLTEFLMRFYEFMSKAPIRVKSQYGFAVNPIFGSFFLSAILCVENGIANPDLSRVDAKVGQTAVLIGDYLEGEGTEWGFGTGITSHLLTGSWIDSGDGRNVERGREKVGDGIEQGLDTLVAEGAPVEDRGYRPGKSEITDALRDQLRRDLGPVEIELEDLFIVF